MDSILDRIFEEVIIEEPETAKAEKCISDTLKNLTADYAKTMNAEEYENMRNKVFCTTFQAEEVGFNLGVRFAIRIVKELLIL